MKFKSAKIISGARHCQTRSQNRVTYSNFICIAWEMLTRKNYKIRNLRESHSHWKHLRWTQFQPEQPQRKEEKFSLK